MFSIDDQALERGYDRSGLRDRGHHPLPGALGNCGETTSDARQGISADHRAFREVREFAGQLYADESCRQAFSIL